MKLNGLTNNLAGNDKSLSNSYLSHIVELLRQEVEALSAKENALEEITNEHIETQKVLVDTKEVKAESVNTNKLQVTSINEKIIISNVIDVLTSLRVNGKDVLTEAAFQGPFTYKGVIETLPETAEAGDVYISNDKVNIFNGTTWDDFILPAGTVSLAEYNNDKAEILSDISTIRNDLDATKSDLANFKADTETSINTIFSSLTNINAELENKVDEAPKNDNAYVRKNGEWVEQTAADNTVKSVAGSSTIENTENGVKIESPKVEINSEDIKVNGTALAQADKFALSKTNKSDNVSTYYELRYKTKPFGPVSSTVCGRTIYEELNRYTIKSTNNQKWTVTTRDYQYCKQCDGKEWQDNTTTYLTSMDREGNIKSMYLPAQQLLGSQLQNYMTDWMVWNPEFCPEGFENKVYLFFPYQSGPSNKAVLLEYDNGDFARSYDMTGNITSQGGTIQTEIVSTGTIVGGEGGKALRNKDIQRICWISKDVATGGTYAIIFGGDKNNKVTDPFDPSKCIYIKLPATASPGYTSMAATDKAWYVSEYATGRMMRITPDGQVIEYTLSKTAYKSNIGDYIEYTDKNGRPACAFRVWVNESNGKEAICFFEEREDGNVSFEEVDLSPYVYTGWDSANWRMMENDYYIFFTAGYGFGPNSSDENNFPNATTVKKLFYWDKKTHTTHIIDDLYGLNATWDNGHMSMYKTKEKAIWIAPNVKVLTTANRTGEFKYILNRDYTNIDENTGKDIGQIEVQTATIGANHPWFTYNESSGFNKYPIMIQDASSWTYSAIYTQYACVNDDGIGFIMSPDYKAFALFYGEGNIKVYEISDIDSKTSTYDPNVQQMLPDEISVREYALSCCEGLKHGWLISGYAENKILGYENTNNSSGFKVYIGLHYKNGEPNILERPTLTILRKQDSDVAYAKYIYNYYSYLLTYDDYERRNKVMRGIFKNITYGYPTRGIDSYYEEVEHNAKKKLNLVYDNKVISSVDD